MSRLDEIAERDGWRCWICDEQIDPQMSVNDARGPSVDAFDSGKQSSGKQGSGKQGSGKQGAKGDGLSERLAHRGCNTKKGAVTPVIPWPAQLFVADPAPLFAVAERLERKGGREVVARCPNRADADETAAWLVDRFARLVPGVAIEADIQPGGGQFMVALAAQQRRR